jgi:hypothetical protein
VLQVLHSGDSLEVSTTERGPRVHHMVHNHPSTQCPRGHHFGAAFHRTEEAARCGGLGRSVSWCP